MRGLQLTRSDGAADQFRLKGEQHARVAQHFAAGFLADSHMNGGIRWASVAPRHPRIVDDDLAKRPADHGAAVHGATTSRGDLCGKTRGKGQQPVRHRIDTGFSEDSHAFDGNRIGESRTRGRTRDQPGQRDGIAADIQYGPAAQRHVVKPRVGLVGRVKAEMGLDVVRHADFAAGDDLQHAGDLGVAAIHEGFHEEAALLLGHLGHRNDFGGIHACGLFAQHMLARPQRRNRQFGMPGVRGRDIDGVDLRIGKKGCVIGMATGFRHGIFVAERLAPRRITAGDGGQPTALRLCQTVGKVVGNAARSDDAPAYGHVIPLVCHSPTT